ncbi:hypothetical protein KKA09_01155 [Patescibacteria group bacterium]|nr:hypothetical protein [Patescibacteria group bacterium]
MENFLEEPLQKKFNEREKETIPTESEIEIILFDLLANIGTGDAINIGKQYQIDLLSTVNELRDSGKRKEIAKNKNSYQKAASGLFLILKEKFLKEKAKGINAYLPFMERYLDKSVIAAEISGDFEKILEISKLKYDNLLQQEELLEAKELKNKISLLEQNLNTN